jgi:hypothetical protein
LRTELIGESGESYPCIIRNLSSHGLGGSGCKDVYVGMRVSVVLPVVGAVSGRVSWTRGDQFGVALNEEMDPSMVTLPRPAAPAPEQRFQVMSMHKVNNDFRRPGVRTY